VKIESEFKMSGWKRWEMGPEVVKKGLVRGSDV
jgi:hypothetical protein